MPLIELLQQLFMTSSLLIFLFLNPFFLVPIIIIIVVYIKKNKAYKKSTYYQITKVPYFSVKHNTGKYGEYLTYKYLKHFETYGAKFLFNIYIPKDNGETTEIDVLMISSKGMFVFESKNYSGWIFGTETQKTWYQTLPKGRGRNHKEHFYNPIMQNRSHIKYLKAFLGEQIPMRSIIVFSDRCTLKSVQIKSNDISVINRYNVYSVVSTIYNQIEDVLLTETDIINLYDKLYPYTQVDEISKEKHIIDIDNDLSFRKKQKVDISTESNQVTDVKNISIQSCETIDEYNYKTILTEQQEKNVDGQTKCVTNPSNTVQDVKETQIFTCPKCNGKLILRTATKGANAGNQFYGCSNYPKCKYIKNI